MNAQANARSSSVSRYSQGIPVLRASALCRTEAEARALLLYATFSSWAPGIAADLEAKARYWRLDETLSRALRIAKATTKRISTINVKHPSIFTVAHPTASAKPRAVTPRLTGTLTLSRPVMH